MPKILEATAEMNEGRKCGQCNEYKLYSEYSRNGSYFTGPLKGQPRYQTKCRMCTNTNIKEKKASLGVETLTRGRKKKVQPEMKNPAM